MPRLIALALLLLFGSNFLGQAWASASSSSMPECCRKFGKHRCAMLNRTGGRAWSAKPCKLFSVRTALSRTASSAASAPASRTQLLFLCFACAGYTGAHCRIDPAPTCFKRGPPSSSIAL